MKSRAAKHLSRKFSGAPRARTRYWLRRYTAERTYDQLVDPAFGFTPDARFDRQGFRNMMALRAEVEGKTTAAPERYLDFSYYEQAMMMVGR